MIVAALASCASQSQPVRQDPPRMAGGDRDEHGCIGSAGYSWCAREGACVRSWELSKEKGFAPSEEAFKRYCLERSTR